MLVCALQGTDISSFQHQDAILWMDELSQLFKFCPETFALGVSIFNRLLASVKVRLYLAWLLKDLPFKSKLTLTDFLFTGTAKIS